MQPNPFESKRRERRERLRATAISFTHLENVTAVVEAARTLLKLGFLELPLPARGNTRERFDALAEIAAHNLSLARIVEGHTDARAILAEASVSALPGIYGVWAAEGGERVEAIGSSHGWTLRGAKLYASGAGEIDRALITARAEDGVRLFDIDLRDQTVKVVPDTWNAVGMSATGSMEIHLEDVLVSSSNASTNRPVGEADFYLSRKGFWHGSVGVAACWAGGAFGAARVLRSRASNRELSPHQFAHLGAVVASCEMMQTMLDRAADEIDATQHTSTDAEGRFRALVVRQLVEQGCQEILTRVGRATGSSALVFDRAHAMRAADLVVYLRQHHAETDLVELAKASLSEQHSAVHQGRT